MDRPSDERHWIHPATTTILLLTKIASVRLRYTPAARSKLLRHCHIKISNKMSEKNGRCRSNLGQKPKNLINGHEIAQWQIIGFIIVFVRVGLSQLPLFLPTQHQAALYQSVTTSRMDIVTCLGDSNRPWSKV